MSKYKWIGSYQYDFESIVYIGFFEERPTIGDRLRSFSLEGDIIATSNTRIYHRDYHPKFGWGSKAFVNTEFPTDPTLTYYIRNSSKKYNTRKKCLTNKG